MSQVLVLSFPGQAEADYLQEILKDLSLMRTAQGIHKAGILNHRLNLKCTKNICRGDIFLQQVGKWLQTGLEAPSVDRRRKFPIESILSALDAYVKFVHLEHVKQDILILEASEEYRNSVGLLAEFPLLKEKFDRISEPISDYWHMFASTPSQQRLAQSTWAGLSWRQRVLLKQSFLAKEIWTKFAQVCRS